MTPTSAFWKTTTLILSLLAPAMDAAAKSLPIDKWPASRRHVVKRTVGGQDFYFLRTSKLQRVHNYNFSCTSVGGHIGGNYSLDSLMRQAAKAYGENGVPAFQVVDYITGNSIGLLNSDVAYQAKLSLDTLRAAQVFHIVSASHLGKTGCVPDPVRINIGRAISEYGIGMMGSHGTGDGGTNEGTTWKFFLDTINPGNPDGHGTRDERTKVYVSNKYRKHVVVESVMVEGYVTSNDMLKHIDGNGQTVTMQTPFRWLRFEPYRYRKPLESIPLAKVLLKYDPSQISDIPTYANFGVNNFSWILAAGKGRIGYYPMGHDLRELTDFTGKIDNVDNKWHNAEESNDLVRYAGQMLFFLAGYNEAPCNSTSCNNLPLVDANDNVIGKYPGPDAVRGAGVRALVGVNFHPSKVSALLTTEAGFAVELSNAKGEVIDRMKGSGPLAYQYSGAPLPKGLYYLKVKLGGKASHVKRYAFL